MAAEAEARNGTRLTIVRRIKAPVEQVYAAWTQPEHLLHWWAPKDAETLEAETDPRVGGRYRVVFRASDGVIHELEGTYLTVQPRRKLVFTWAWQATPEQRSEVTASFADLGGETLLTLEHELLADAATRDDHHQGWMEGLDKLEAYLRRQWEEIAS